MRSPPVQEWCEYFQTPPTSMEPNQNNPKRARKGGEEVANHENLPAATATAVAVAHFPEEIIQNILARLPVRSLLRFRSVDKQWRSLISDPQFLKQHRHHTRTAAASANRRMRAAASVIRSKRYIASLTSVVDDGNETRIVEAELNHNHPFSPSIVGSANGLLLMCNDSRVWLWNPCTDESKNFPQQSHMLMSYMASEAGVKGNQITGFGYASTTDEYKAVIIAHLQPICPFQIIYIFTSKTGLWTESEYRHGFPYLAYASCISSHGITVNNGAPHWLVRGSRVTESVIVYFDWTEERLREVPLPDSLLHYKRSVAFDLADFGGCVSVADGRSDTHIDVWVMKEHGVKESWTKLFAFPKSMPSDFLIPLGFAMDDKVLLLINYRILVT